MRQKEVRLINRIEDVPDNPEFGKRVVWNIVKIILCVIIGEIVSIHLLALCFGLILLTPVIILAGVFLYGYFFFDMDMKDEL